MAARHRILTFSDDSRARAASLPVPHSQPLHFYGWGCKPMAEFCWVSVSNLVCEFGQVTTLSCSCLCSHPLSVLSVLDKPNATRLDAESSNDHSPHVMVFRLSILITPVKGCLTSRN